MSVDSTWIEHRRGSDGQPLGWMEPSGEGSIAVDLLVRQRSEVVDWLTAEEVLEEMGIGYLAEQYELQLDDGQWLQVRLAQVSTEGIVVKQDDWGANAIDAPQQFHELRFPAPDVLRPMRHYGGVPSEPEQECGQ